MGAPIALRRAALDPKRIEYYMRKNSREPFLKALADFMECQPTPDSIKKFADKSPDRWAQAIAIMARLTGFSEKIEVSQTITHVIAEKSDSDLLLELSRLREGVFGLAEPEGVKISNDSSGDAQLDMFDLDDLVDPTR